MKAIIMAGGQAVRLRPITNDTPKCLLKIGDQTIIDFQIATLKKNNINDVVMITGFCADLLEKYVSERHSDIHFTFVRNKDFQTTRPAYGLWLAREHLKGEPVIYLNADLLCESSIFDEVIQSGKTITAIQKIEWNEEAVNVILHTNGEVLEIGKHINKDTNHGEFLGIIKMSEGFCEELVKVLEEFESASDRNRFAVDAVNGVIIRGKEKLYSLDVTDRVAIEVDTLADYEAGQKIWKEYEQRTP